MLASDTAVDRCLPWPGVPGVGRLCGSYYVARDCQGMWGSVSFILRVGEGGGREGRGREEG